MKGARAVAQQEICGAALRAVEAGVDVEDVVAEVFDEVREHRPILGTALSVMASTHLGHIDRRLTGVTLATSTGAQ